MFFSLNDVSFTRNSTFKMKDVTFGIERGEMLGIIGPNGSGKTTLLKIMAGILRPHRGSIMVNGSNMHTLKHRDLARIRAYVPEGIDLPFDYDVYDIVALGRHPYAGMLSGLDGKDRAAIDSAFELTDTRGLLHRKFFALSMGEKQRVMLAMAIAQGPELLLLDEPISHLDIGHQLAFVRTLKQLNRGGMTIVSALHELPIAQETFGRLCLMDSGRIVRACPAGDKGLLEDIKGVFGVNDERFIVCPSQE